MKYIRIIMVCFLTMMSLTGCKEEEIKAPEVSISDTVKQYLDAMKAQDGLAMADLTVNHEGYDFTIKEADAQSLGMTLEAAQKFYQQMLHFTYVLEPETIQDTKGSVVVHVTTYDVNQILSDTVEANKEAFGKINGEKISEEEKNQKIADIIIQAFVDAEQSYTFDVTFHCQLIDQVWLIENADETIFYDALFGQASEAET